MLAAATTGMTRAALVCTSGVTLPLLVALAILIIVCKFGASSRRGVAGTALLPVSGVTCSLLVALSILVLVFKLGTNSGTFPRVTAIMRTVGMSRTLSHRAGALTRCLDRGCRLRSNGCATAIVGKSLHSIDAAHYYDRDKQK